MSTIPRTSGIYKWTCTPTRKIYIGSAINLQARRYGHRAALRNKRHSNMHFQRAWDKYGEDAFTFVVLELVLAPFLLEREQYYLDKLKPFGRKGFNIFRTAGSPYGHKASEETRRKMSESQKRRNSGGRKWTQEQRDKLSSRLKGKSLSPEHREKIRQALKGRILGDREKLRNTRLLRVKPKPEKTKAKRLGASHEALVHARAHAVEASAKEYRLISPDGNSMVIKNLSKFAREHEMDFSGLRKVLSGKRLRYKGWGCEYID